MSLIRIKSEVPISISSLNNMHTMATYIEHLLYDYEVSSKKYYKHIYYEGIHEEPMGNLIVNSFRLDVVKCDITLNNKIYNDLIGIRFYYNGLFKSVELIFNTPEDFKEYKKVKFKELIEVLKQVTLI